MLPVSSRQGSSHANTLVSLQPREMQFNTDLAAYGKGNVLLHKAGTIPAHLFSNPILTLSVCLILEKQNPNLLNIHIFVLLPENKSSILP